MRVEIAMSNSAGIFQVDELLATKLRGSGLEQHVEVIAQDRGRARAASDPGVSDLSAPDLSAADERYQCTPRIRCASATCSVDAAASPPGVSPFAAAESGNTL